MTTPHISGAYSVSASTYRNYGCRCDGCKAEALAANREWRRRRGPGMLRSEKVHQRAVRLAAQWVQENRPDVWDEVRMIAETEISGDGGR